MALPLSLTASTEYGHNETIASFASLEEAEEALSSIRDQLEEASPSRAFSLSCLASQLEELLLEASETEEEPLS